MGWSGNVTIMIMLSECKKCNTGAKSVTPVQITHRNSEF